MNSKLARAVNPAPGPAVATHGWRLMTLRAIAMVELAKGAIVLLAGAGLLSLLHRDVEDIADKLVRHLHLNPASDVPRIFLELAARLSSSNLWLLALGAAAYAAIRFAEAYGLWRDRAWAEWLGAVSGLIYVPFELHALTKGVTALKVTLLCVNLIVVWVLSDALAQRGRKRNLRV